MGVKLAAALGGSVELVPTNTASNYTATFPASTGTVLTTTSPKTGNVIQVVSTAKTDTWSATTQTFTDITGLSVTITPSSSSSKILVLLDLACGVEASNAALPRILRNGTAIYVGDAAGSRPQASGQAYTGNAYAMVRSGSIYLDSPATTSAVTYKAQLRSTGLVIQYVNQTGRDANDPNYDARGASSITVMEIAA
jgi:hypothetical protein